MRRPRDTEGDMADPRFRLDAGTADRLLGGRVAPDDAPPGYAEVAGLLQTLAADLPSRPAAAGEDTIRMMAKVVRISDPLTSRRRPPPLRARIVALAMVGSLGTAGVAFAGGLPDAAQRVVSTWFARIGVMIPHPRDGAGPNPAEPSGADPHAPDTQARVTDPAGRRAIAIRADREDRGARAVDGTGGRRPDERGDGTTQGTVVDASSGPPTPPVATPSGGGTGAAEDASDGTSRTGTEIADERSVGRSAAGSNNAGSSSGADSPLTPPAGAPPEPEMP